MQFTSHLSDFDLTDHPPRLQSRTQEDHPPEISDDLDFQGEAGPKLTATQPEYNAAMQPRHSSIEWNPRREYGQQRTPAPPPELASEVLSEVQQL